MLDIQNMSKEHTVLNFLYELQPCAQMELQRQNVKDCLVNLLLLMVWLISRLTKILAQVRLRVKGLGMKEDGQNLGIKFSKGNQGCFLCNGPIVLKIVPRKRSWLLLLWPIITKSIWLLSPKVFCDESYACVECHSFEGECLEGIVVC